MKHYNPAHDISNGIVGRKLPGYWRYPDARSNALSILEEDEHLYAVLTYSDHQVAICVADSADFDEAFLQYAEGIYTEFELYALREEYHQLAW